MSKLVPKLRFEEFSGEWKEVVLKSLGQFKGGGTPSKQKPEYWKGDIPWISSSDINKDNINYINISKFINEKSIKESATKIIPKNSILFVSRVGVGKLAINKQELCTSQDFTNFIPYEINSYYLGYFFIANKNLLNAFNQGTSIKGFTKSDLETLKIKIPEAKEQQKIANTLSSLDNLIEAQNKKVEALKKHKKGLMQGLFPKEGEKVPELRFDGFFGEWEEKRLGEIGNLISGLTYSPNDVRDKGLLVLRSSNIQNDKITLDDTVYVEPNIKGVNLSHSNDILICIRNGSKALIGKNALIPNNMPVSTHGAFMTVFRTDLAKFVYQVFQTSSYRKQVDADLGATINSINGNNLKKYIFYIPKERKEQQKIANCLNSLDNLIEAQTKKIKTLKQHKKGLMQGLFVSAGA